MALTSDPGGRDRYFDNAATTPLDPRVLSEMLPYLQADFGNAHSIHTFGQKARDAVERARSRVAEAIGAEDPSQITFNSGATEANNQVISSFASGAISPFEHSAVREPALQGGFQLLANDGLKILPPQSRVELISVMTVSNELGAVWTPSVFEPYADFVHTDATQAVGKFPISVEGIAFASCSAHKLYGPKGVGALYSRDAAPKTLLRGGDQENHVRAGTLNVPGIVGMGLATYLAVDEWEANLAHVTALRAVFLEELDSCTDWQVNGGENASPYILSLSFADVEGESLVVEIDKAGYAISSGAACSTGSTEPSHVLTALGMEHSLLRGTVRVSFGKYCTIESTRGLANSLRFGVTSLRKMSQTTVRRNELG